MGWGVDWFVRVRRPLIAAAAAGMALLGVSAAGAQEVERCAVPSDLMRLVHPLKRAADRLAAGEPLVIVAIGSSSTAGAGATSEAASYPARLAVELQRLFPGRPIKVLNRGVNGEVARDMLARFDSAVLAEKPDLVLWQVGTNSVLRDDPLASASMLIREGVRRLKSSGADVVLMDPQFAPSVIAKPEAEVMVGLISSAAKEANVDLFQRFAVMRHWHQVQRIPFSNFITPDDLHMNDWGYACCAKLLASALAEAVGRAHSPEIAVRQRP